MAEGLKFKHIMRTKRDQRRTTKKNVRNVGGLVSQFRESKILILVRSYSASACGMATSSLVLADPKDAASTCRICCKPSTAQSGHRR